MRPGAVTLGSDVMFIRPGVRCCAGEASWRPSGPEVRAELGPELARLTACACRRHGPTLLLDACKGALVCPELSFELTGRLLGLVKALVDLLGHQAKLA